ncbi:hypothetical protein [Ekhidna sp.]
MPNKNALRPVTVTHKGEKIEGFFHRFTYSYSSFHSETQALIEHTDGRLRYYDPYFVQFTDRQVEAKKPSKK